MFCQQEIVSKNRREVQVQETSHNKEVILKEAMEIQEDTAEVS